MTDVKQQQLDVRFCASPRRCCTKRTFAMSITGAERDDSQAEPGRFPRALDGRTLQRETPNGTERHREGSCPIATNAMALRCSRYALVCSMSTGAIQNALKLLHHAQRFIAGGT